MKNINWNYPTTIWFGVDRIIEIQKACEELNISPKECVFLDDLGINLKPARAIGMTTIKVISESQALHDLGTVLNEDLMN